LEHKGAEGVEEGVEGGWAKSDKVINSCLLMVPAGYQSQKDPYDFFFLLWSALTSDGKGEDVDASSIVQSQQLIGDWVGGYGHQLGVT